MQSIRYTGETPTIVAAPKADFPVPRLTVEQVDNHIYFYSGVDTDRCLALIRSIRSLDSQLRNERATRDIPDDHPAVPIWLHIHSGGGDLMAALGVVDQIPRFKTPIYSIVEGMCASAATLISMACTQRYITPRSHMLIHQFFSIMWGTYEQFKDDMVLQKSLMSQLVQFYSGHSKLGRKEVRKILKHDSWFNAEQCLAHGFVSETL